MSIQAQDIQIWNQKSLMIVHKVLITSNDHLLHLYQNMNNTFQNLWSSLSVPTPTKNIFA